MRSEGGRKLIHEGRKEGRKEKKILEGKDAWRKGGGERRRVGRNEEEEKEGRKKEVE